jgi:carbohydrate-selective porin OprB
MKTIACSLLLLTTELLISVAAIAQSIDPSPTDTSFMHRKYLLGDWSGERSKLANEGVTFDLFYVADFLANPAGGNSSTSAWNRVRGTVDIDFGKLAGANGLTMHVTGVWQGGVNLGGQYLGSIANPSGLVSAHTTRLDSYWLQQELFKGKLTVRGGQFAGQDFYGVQYYGREYLMEPLDYALGNLFSAYESFDPASGPGVDIKIAPMQQLYLRSAYMSGNRNPYGYNATGVPFTWKNSGLIINELGILVDQPSFYGQRAAKVPGGTQGSTPPPKKFYPGLYKLGLVNNPGRNAFAGPSATVVSTNSYVRCYGECYSGDYIFYFMANQAVWRPTEGSNRGLDANFAVDYLPSDRNKVNQQFTGGVIFNAPITKRADDSASFGFVISRISDVFDTYQQTNLLLRPQTSEKAFEFNYLAQVTPFWYVQPVVQVYASLGATPSNGTGVVVGFRTKVTF